MKTHMRPQGELSFCINTSVGSIPACDSAIEDALSLAVTRAEQGQEAAAEVAHALRLLQVSRSHVHLCAMRCQFGATTGICAVHLASLPGLREPRVQQSQKLRLLQERGDRHAAFWACPPCDAAFPSSTEFGEHLYTFHEEAVYADEAAGTYLTCSHCGQEVRIQNCTNASSCPSACPKLSSSAGSTGK